MGAHDDGAATRIDRVEIEHPFGTLVVPLEDWLRIGPGPRPGVAPVAVLLADGTRLPPSRLPLAARNTSFSRLLTRPGLLTPPWEQPR